jgi:hypothetical protein
MSNDEATGQPRSSPIESHWALGLGPAALGVLAIGAAAIGLLAWRSRTLSEVASRRSSTPPKANPLALALGAAALGALAIGAVAIGYLAVGRLVVGKARIRELEVDDLTIQRLHVVERDGPTA